ncbi:MAG: prolipoprotein diacylglyceryl transferase [Oscillospiraceae bacterium]|nr:prolipoprotein diacylglyceryl transferase [Oscillospiraceae bacterium]
MLPFISIFGIDIPTYGLMLLTGAAVAWLLIFLLARKKQSDIEDVSMAFLICICGGLVGAVSLRPLMKLVEVALAWERYKLLPAGEVLQYIIGEMVFYGGLLGGLCALIIYCRKYKIKIAPLIDLFIPAIAIAHAIGRIGCHLAGCCYGIVMPHGHPLAVVYPPNAIGAPSGIPLLSIPLIEAALLLLLSTILVVIYLKSKYIGTVATVYFLVYSTLRFFIEYFRGDLIRGKYGIFTTSQIISIVMLVSGLVYYFGFCPRINKREVSMAP